MRVLYIHLKHLELHLLDDLVAYWKETAENGGAYHRDDAALIEKYKPDLPRGRVPEPWFGVPTKAKVFYLSLNPGHKPDDGSAREPWRSFCRDMMLEHISYERYLSEAPPEAITWFKRNHGGFADHTFPKICNLRLIAYPSSEKSDLKTLGQAPELLPSSRLMLRVVHDYLVPHARRGHILLLVMRSPEFGGLKRAMPTTGMAVYLFRDH